jgi:hypothetical protein
MKRFLVWISSFYVSVTAALIFPPGTEGVKRGLVGLPHRVGDIPDLEGSAHRQRFTDESKTTQSSTTKDQRQDDRSNIVVAMQGEKSMQAQEGGNPFLKLILKKDTSKPISPRHQQCSLPAALAVKRLAGGSPTVPNMPDQRDTSLSVEHLLQSLAKTTRVTEVPFLWLHWGESDFMCLANRKTAHNVEHTDYHSGCVYHGLKEALLGDDYMKDANVVQALGAFFLCRETHRTLYSGMQNFILTNSELGHAPSYPFYDSFYLPVGNESSAAVNSWVQAAKNGKRPVVLVGPDHLSSLHCMLNYVKHFRIPLPTTGCQDVEPLVAGIVELSQASYPNESVVFVVAGAAIGKIVAYQAFKKLQHKDIFVDVGASLDAYAGVRSRDFNKDLTKFCRESKGWMAYDVCEKECQDVHRDRPCQQCGQ